MIPRKEAKLLLREVRDRISFDTDAEEARFIDATETTIGESVLVLRGAENVEQKARRYLVEGRLTLERVAAHQPTGEAYVLASCRGSEGTYRLGYDPKEKRWGCTCPVKGKKCAHLVALRLVVDPEAMR